MSKPSLKERLASSFSGQARAAALPAAPAKAAELPHLTRASASDRDSESANSSLRTGGKASKTSKSDTSNSETDDLMRCPPQMKNVIAASSAPLLIDILENNPFATDCTVEELTTWLQQRTTSKTVKAKNIIALLHKEGLIVELDEKKVRFMTFDVLGMAENPQVAQIFKEQVVGNTDRLAKLVQGAYRTDRIRCFLSLLSLVPSSNLQDLMRIMCKKRLRDTNSAAELFRVDDADTALLSGWNRRNSAITRALVR
jgi:hypothetical protein